MTKQNSNTVYSTSNKRIAKNTFYLYLRMLMVMVVSLFTVRVVLNALGAEDYGINNVVGGFVAMFAFLSSTLTSASLRFFAYSIGKNDQEKLSQYFTMSFWCYAILAVVIIVIAEPLGLWFVSNKMTIPAERMDAALWVFHFSVISFAVKVITVPYNSIVIAHERMNMYAILGVVECVLKLGVAYLIYISPFDKLKTYSLLMFIMLVAVDGFYFIYGLGNFQECRIRRYWSRQMFTEIANYSGWSLFGALSSVARGQGINILLNVFFNPIVNAARAIAFQVNTQISHFVLNFYKAVQPQITKSYGAGDIEGMHSLVYRSSRFCYYLIFIISLPVLLEADLILTLWLKEFPDNTVLFTRLVIITAIIDSTSYPLQTSISATGRIKYFQLITGGLLILNLPLAWIFLYYGCPPESTMYVAMGVSTVAQITRIAFAKHYINLSIHRYLHAVLSPICAVTVLSFVLPLYVHSIMPEDILRFFIVSTISIITSLTMVWLLGITKDERATLTNLVLSKLNLKR